MDVAAWSPAAVCKAVLSRWTGTLAAIPSYVSLCDVSQRESISREKKRNSSGQRLKLSAQRSKWRFLILSKTGSLPLETLVLPVLWLTLRFCCVMYSPM